MCFVGQEFRGDTEEITRFCFTMSEASASENLSMNQTSRGYNHLMVSSLMPSTWPEMT